MTNVPFGNPQQERAPRPKELDTDLINQCRAFLAIEVPNSNILFVEDFDKYMVLFNKERFNDATPEERDIIGREYHSVFSMQHPIKLLSHEHDPNGVMHPIAREKFKVVSTIPATFRRVSTLNDLGEKVPTLMNAFMNANSSSAGPFDPRKGQYAKAIAEAINTADKKEGLIEKQRSKFQHDAEALTHHDKPTEEQSEEKDEDSVEGMFDWD